MNKQSETLGGRDGGAPGARTFACLRAILGGMILIVLAFAAAGPADAETRSLKLYNVHTKERATIVYKRNGKYDRAGLAKVNQFLRDWRRNEPTKMDPELLDVVWDVYRQTRSDDYIHVISAYRSPATNGELRKRSKGVAKNSQHTRGKAMDFYIPGVSLTDLRAIGLRMHAGGVGYYPTSGSPFVHLDTGSVRHWPRMTRKQLVQVFPNGKTLHVPSDGKPLPGYAQALAAHKLGGRSSGSAVASAGDEPPIPPKSKKSVGDPIVIASVSGASDDELEGNSVAEIAAMEPPLPRPSPIPVHSQKPPVIVATAEPVPQFFHPRTEPTFALATTGVDPAPRRAAPFDFESAGHWSSPSVPADLARAMAQRDVSRPTSLPIRPTAVVATIDVSRPLRAEAMTTAVMQGREASEPVRDVTPVFAYAATIEPPAPTAAPQPRHTAVEGFDSPIPVANPLLSVQVPGPVEPSTARRMPREDLTLTALDTLGLKLWMANQSTRQKQYAVLTMPDFGEMPSLIEKPTMAYSGGFGDLAYQGLRTDRFSGPLVRLPAIVDLESRQRLAYR